MQSSFFQKFLLTITLAFFTACGIWGLRHIVLEAMWETSNAGWKQSLFPDGKHTNY